ncbi:MAG TPA: hypothetical protein IAA54_08445 [Candidatus Gallacutalibacter pullicola]|uniref:Uncharacterized protein n=1 Tax=Candidatus Gallacutalibacter pullicola TaxID=2840830 RepID=A0A9D1J1Y2_9FIRM|nr:hypothetical protein [Candidatus Gallacutalibacter pullicola]
MKKELGYAEKMKWRIRALWMALALMLVYMVVVAELDGGDSRMMTNLANMVSDIIFFGGIIFLISRIVHNKKLLKDRALLREQLCRERDERNQYLHDKSGGIVMDVLLFILLFTTCTAALFNMAAFSVSVFLLAAAVILKASAWLFYSYRKME